MFLLQFSNLLGTIYRKGNVIFSPDGNSVISPVGNKITIYNLKTSVNSSFYNTVFCIDILYFCSNKAKTLSCESKYNYTAIDISPNGCLMVAANERGEAQMISMVSYTVIHTYKLSSTALCVKFSPDGKFFAMSKDNMGKI